MRNIHKFKDWEKADQENLKLNNKRTSIKRLFELVDDAYQKQVEQYNDSNLIEYRDMDPNFEYELYVPDNKHIISGKYAIGYNVEYKPNEDDAYDEYYFSVNNIHVENSHKLIPLVIKTFKELFDF